MFAGIDITKATYIGRVIGIGSCLIELSLGETERLSRTAQVYSSQVCTDQVREA